MFKAGHNVSRDVDVCIIGFGMAGVAASQALQHVERFTADGVHVRPRLTILEAGDRVGGKVAPDNLGAQFLDADALGPIERMLEDLDVQTHPARDDYELVELRLGNKRAIDPAEYARALQVLRGEMLSLLHDAPFSDLDGRSVLQVLHGLRHRGALSDDGEAAMRQRLLLEDGTLKLSALGYALALAKTPMPMRRVEVVGGLYRLVSRARDAARAAGAELCLGARVRSLEATSSSVRVRFTLGDDEPEQVRDFDAVILAVSPEHLGRVAIAGATPAALPALRALQPARITKSNLVVDGAAHADEHATEAYAMWFTSRKQGRRPQTQATFFHGWEGRQALSSPQMAKAALGHRSSPRVLRESSQTWDASTATGEDVPMGYISEPRVGQCVPLLRASRDALFGEGRLRSAVKLATHALAIGGGVREAALCGEWAAVTVLEQLGLDVARAFERVPDPQREVYGASRELLARQLDAHARVAAREGNGLRAFAGQDAV